MKISRAFDLFEAALKSMKTAEIAVLVASGAEDDAASDHLGSSLEQVRRASRLLWSAPATGPSDLVIKARALRWHFPAGVELPDPVVLGHAEDPPHDAPLASVALHYIVRDLLALSE